MLGTIPVPQTVSNDAYEAFKWIVTQGGCPYDRFTPDACTKGEQVWEKGINNKSINVNLASFHPAGQDQVYSYSLGNGYADTTKLTDNSLNKMVSDLALSLGLISVPVTPAPVVTTTNTTVQSVIDSVLPSNTVSWFGASSFGVPNSYLLGAAVVGVGIMFMGGKGGKY